MQLPLSLPVKNLHHCLNFFSVKLKFTVDILNKWFKHAIQSKSLELNIIQKTNIGKENPVDTSKTTYCIYGFWLDIERAHKTA